mgnify:CR=1 FL=1
MEPGLLCIVVAALALFDVFVVYYKHTLMLPSNNVVLTSQFSSCSCTLFGWVGAGDIVVVFGSAEHF